MATQEPDTGSNAVRAFEADYRPLCANLAEVRANIDRLDDQIVRLLAERARYVKDATRFKRDSFQVSARRRQEQVFEHARELARLHGGGLEHLENIVDATYRAMVAAFIASEQRYFNTTRTHGDKRA